MRVRVHLIALPGEEKVLLIPLAPTCGRYSSPPDYAPHYVEKLLYMPHAFFVNDHRQVSSARFDTSTYHACQ